MADVNNVNNVTITAADFMMTNYLTEEYAMFVAALMRFKLKVETRMKRVLFVLYTKKVKLKVMEEVLARCMLFLVVSVFRGRFTDWNVDDLNKRDDDFFGADSVELNMRKGMDEL
jgi:hypothetical protein